MPSDTAFAHFRQNQLTAGLSTEHEDSLICPLCWEETRYADLSVEHTIPGAIGGVATVLTCRRCNNEQGSSLDAHLVKFQDVADAFRGHGAIPAKLDVNGKQVVANLAFEEDAKHFRIVGKASNPRSSEAIQADFEAGLVSSFNVTLDFGYSKNRFQTAVLRAAYLILFRRFGYQYVKHEVVQAIRRRIADPSLSHPRSGSLIVEFRNPVIPVDKPHFIAQGDVNGTKFFFVVIRARRQTTSYLAAFMPIPDEGSEHFFELMERCSQECHGERLTIPGRGLLE